MFIKILKKTVFIAFIFIFSLTGICFADDEIEDITEEDTNSIMETVQTSGDNTKEPETYSKHIICIERTTNEVLYEKDAYTKTPMASTTKIMTFLVAYENCNFDESVEISSKAANTGGSTLGITAGTTMTMESLIYGLMLRSRK